MPRRARTPGAPEHLGPRVRGPAPREGWQHELSGLGAIAALYAGDLAYGTKTARIRSEAENILALERDLVAVPSGLPTLAALHLLTLTGLLGPLLEVSSESRVFLPTTFPPTTYRDRRAYL